jgi:hypothetical protein
LQNRLIQTSQTGGQQYSDTSRIPWYGQHDHRHLMCIYTSEFRARFCIKLARFAK